MVARALVSCTPRAVGNLLLSCLNWAFTFALNSRRALSLAAFGIFLVRVLNSFTFLDF